MNKLTQKELIEHFTIITNKMIEIITLKNTDYSGNNLAFKNFELITEITHGKISTEEGILVRITDKIQRIANLLYKENQVKDEKITDTLLDLANYALILLIYIKTNETTTIK